MLKKSHWAVAAAAALVFVSGQAMAQYKPSKPVEFVTHTGPGGGGDVLARFIASAIEKENLAPVRLQIANKTGGGGLTAMSYVAGKKGDDHTIAIFTGIWYTNPLMLKEAKHSMKDLTPLVRLVMEPALIAVKADSPFKTLKDFIDAAKQKPGEMKQSAGSIGARDWIVRQLLMKNTGTNWAYISFPGGGERISALLGGHVNMMVIEPQEAGEHIRAGNMRVIAQVSETRLSGFPNVPTLKEAGFNVTNVPQVRGIAAPPGVAPDVIKYWEDLFAKLIETPTWKKYLADNQFESAYMRSADLGKFGDGYIDITRKILVEGGVKVAN